MRRCTICIHYSNLSKFERCRLFEWYQYQKKPIREVARLLNRSHATISREIRRNRYYYYVPTYYPHPAQFYYGQRMKERAKRIKLKSIETQQYVTDKLELGWTPEIIAGRIKLNETRYPTCLMKRFTNTYTKKIHPLSSICQDNIRNANGLG
ncbi:helix-turn-helix domain-containing protein [Paraglaciecola arctica]|uniref:helix-turn-helix domain-containing protein n=1 Tax=Paraglaciecola arctica TaxID=1128911 RepID=UPI001C06843B|nr:helix-turn-helix domain-containing protein [Paraglaciecola arctica]